MICICFELLVLADVLRKSAVDTDVLWQLQSLHETEAWAAEHQIDMAALHEVQKAQMLGMTAVASKSFVVEHSMQSRARYQANCKAVFEYVEAMAERNELYDEAEHRSHINAMVRLMRFGICRSKYWTESRKDYDGVCGLPHRLMSRLGGRKSNTKHNWCRWWGLHKLVYQ